MGQALDRDGNVLGEADGDTKREVFEKLNAAHKDAAEIRIKERLQEQVPRRARLDRLTAAERAIFDAVQAVETLPADVRLTDAVVLLQAARESVADFVDGIDQRRVLSLQA